MGTFKLFKMHLRVPFLLLALAEFAICLVAVYVAVHVRFNGQGLMEVSSIRSPVLSSMLFGLVMPTTMMAMGLYQSRFRGGVLGVFLRSIIGFLSGAAFLSFLFYLVPSLYLGRGVFGLAILIAFFMVGTLRPMFFHFVDKDILKIRSLVLGTGIKAASIDQRLRRRVDRRGFRIKGYLPLVPIDGAGTTAIETNAASTARPAAEAAGIPEALQLAHNGHSLLQICQDLGVDEIVIAADERRKCLPLEQLLECKLYGIEVIDLLGFFEREQGKLPLNFLRPDWLIYSEGFDRGTFRDVVKRLFDILVSVLILSLTWPFMLLTWLAIKLEDGQQAPVLYRQERTGYLGQPFDVLKFRSMRTDAEKAGVAQWATANDTRVTRVGEFIRKTRIDELPQILNVLRGDMSFVGPRPERPQFVNQLSTQIPYYAERHAVKPGITGWAQVCYPYGASLNDSIQKQEYDLFYIKNHTIFLDVLILLQTAEVVLFGKGAR